MSGGSAVDPSEPRAGGPLGWSLDRWRVLLFCLLALATVGAFYITQHLKTKNPLINGGPRADPAMINPVSAGVCVDANGENVSFRRTRIAFYLQSHSDVVSVYVINSDGINIATMSGSNRYIKAALNNYHYFTWNGKENDGAYAPAGIYTFRAWFHHQDRSFPVTTNASTDATVEVTTARPHPKVTAVTVSGMSATAGQTPVFTPRLQTATLHIGGGPYLAARVLVYRASDDPDAPLQLVKQFGINPRAETAVWDGTIAGKPAPAGSYLLGLAVKSRSCTAGTFPLVDDPVPGTTTGAGVNVAYLTATPPLDPTPAGQLASVAINSGGRPYKWALRHIGVAKAIFHGVGAVDQTLRVKMPAVGLYVLTVRAGTRRTQVPLVASGVGPRSTAGVLVVLPALSWQGVNAADDNADGLADSLSAGGQITLSRPMVSGLPSGLGDEASLLTYLNSQHDDYQLTTDVALAQGIGPSLTGRHGVLLDGQFKWVPSPLVSRLGAFVSAGGGAFTDAVNSLQNEAPLTTTSDSVVAGPATALSPDPFGVHHGAVASAEGQLITSLADHLGLFTDVPVLDFSAYQVLDPPGGQISSAAGIASTAPAVIGFSRGKGIVVEAGLPGFGTSLGSSIDSQELLNRVWQLVLR